MTSQPELWALSPQLERAVRDMNPWWRGDPVPPAPAFRRWPFARVLRDLKGGMTLAVVLRGPRRVGKSVLLEQVVAALLSEGVDPNRILRLVFDDLPAAQRLMQPILELPSWYAGAVLGKALISAAADGTPVFVLLDEVQNLRDWAPQLKHLVDIHKVRVLVTGSSALRIQAGHDSLAGRVTTIEMGPLLLREIGSLRRFGDIPPYQPTNGLAPLRQKEFWLELRAFGERHAVLRKRAFAAFSERGAYPEPHHSADVPWDEVADYLNETVVRRAIQHDLRMGDRGRRRNEALLGEVFRLACRYVGQSPGWATLLAEAQQAMNANIGAQQIRSYLGFLDGTLLMRLVEPLELRLKKKRGAAKFVLSDHALRAAWLQEVVPLAPDALAAQPHLTDLAGRIAESTVGYFFQSMPNLGVAHFPERGAEPEVDYVLTVGDQRIPVEVKYRRQISHGDTLGLRAFVEKSVYNAPFGVLVTLGEEARSDDPRIVSLPLSSLLLMR